MQQSTIYRIYGISFILTLTMLSVFMYLNHNLNGSYWQTMQQSKSALTAEYCELDQTTHFFRQTMNTYSNLMYFFLGMIVVLIGFYDRNNETINKNAIQQFPAISILFGCCLIYLCIGSAFFHASLTWFGQRVDMNGTYSICIVLIGISAYRFFSKTTLSKTKQLTIILSLVVIILLFVKIHLLVSSIFLLPLLMLTVVSFAVLNYSRRKENYRLSFALLSLLFVIGAFVLRTLDVKKIACNPTSFYQGHALWHFFTGMSAFILYWFYRSEKV